MSTDPKSSYYDVGGIETIDIIKAKSTREEYRGYLRCNVIKYATRLGYKADPQRDAEKLAMYAKWLCEWYEEEALRASGMGRAWTTLEEYNASTVGQTCNEAKKPF